MSSLADPPTYAQPGSNAWTMWFLQVARAINNATAGNISHNNLLNIQGGGSTERYHMTAAEYSTLQAFINGSKTIPLPVASTPSAITVGASPFTYANSATYDVDVIVAGGTVSAVTLNRVGSYNTGVLAGMLRLSPGDSLTVTYSVAPAMTLVPR